MQRAGIYQANIQLDYLKDRLQPELEKAVILNRAKNLADGIHIATEIEQPLAKSKMSSTYMGPVNSYSSSSDAPQANKSASNDDEQNHQDQPRKFKKTFGNHDGSDGGGNGFKINDNSGTGDTRACFRCNKKGHLKRDCRMKTFKQNNQHLIVKEDPASSD